MADQKWNWDTLPEYQAQLKAYQDEQEAGTHPNWAAAVRGVAPFLSAEGGLMGAGVAGLSEVIAQALEHSATKPFSFGRIGVEAGLGAVPLGKIIKAGKVGTSILRSGALSGVGETMREAVSDEDFSAKKIGLATGIGAATGGAGSFLGKFMGKGAQAAEDVPKGRMITTTGDVPGAPMPSPTVQQGPFQRTGTTWPMALPAHQGTPPNLKGIAMGETAAEVNGGGLHMNQAPGLVASHGQFVGSGTVHPTWAAAVGEAKKLGIPSSAVVKAEGGYRIGGATTTQDAAGAVTRPTSGGGPNNGAPTVVVNDAPSDVRMGELMDKFGGQSTGIDRANADMPRDPVLRSKPIKGTAKKTVTEMQERQGVSAGRKPYDPEQGTVATPISGAMQAYPEGERQGFLFGQHDPKTIIRAEKTGDTIVRPDGGPPGKGFTIGSGLGGAQDVADLIQRNPTFALRLATSAAGAGLGAATADEDHRMEGALIGGAAGAMVPSLPNVLQTLGVKAEGLTNANLSTKEGLSVALDKILHTIPQIQRFNYLASASGLPANAMVGPYGAALMGAIEHSLAGDPRGMKALQVLKNPATFMEMYGSEWAAKEAERLLTEAHNPELGGERAEDIANKGIRMITDKLSLPGKFMTRGDVVARKILADAGFSEQEQRVITLTAEPYTKLFKGIAHAGQGSAVGQMLFPFRRTPANIGERGLERIPGVGSIVQLRRLADGKDMDPLKQQLVQQLMGAGAGVGGYTVGNNTDPENAKMIRKYMTNAAGMYSLPMAIGLAAGRAHQYGQSPLSTGTLAGIREALPLPSVQPVMDIFNAITKHQLPRGVVPADVYDYLKEQE